tara:strand:- start:270 stop:1010 length:741 start_codon:yes stop_codon:yes gene_type:complete
MNKREKIIQLIKQDKSINHISRTLEVGKSTIYYHYKKIKGRKIKEVKINGTDDMIGEFIGLFAGDGCFYKAKNYLYRIYLIFNITEKNFVLETKDLLTKLFDKSPSMYRSLNTLILLYRSRDIFDFIMSYLQWSPYKRKAHTICLRNHNHSRAFKIGFLRGNVDSDGHISKNVISFASSSPYLIDDIRKFLSDLNIQHKYREYEERRTNRVNMHHVRILKEDRTKFMLLIKPRELKNLKKYAPAGI